MYSFSYTCIGTHFSVPEKFKTRLRIKMIREFTKSAMPYLTSVPGVQDQWCWAGYPWTRRWAALVTRAPAFSQACCCNPG
jgi:hypothetical protein